MKGFTTTRQLTKLANLVCEDLGFLFTTFTDDQFAGFGAIPDEYVAGFIASQLNVAEGAEDFDKLEELVEESLKLFR